MQRRYLRPAGLALAVVATLAVALGASGFGRVLASRYYPETPRKVTTAEMALQTYFDALFFASNLTEAEMGAAGGTVGMGREPYAAAYDCWTKEWQAKHPFAEFVDSWQGTANVELIKMIPAGKGKDSRRFYVEAKSIEAAGKGQRLGIFYYSGFFSIERQAKQYADGWAIAAGSLAPESLGFRIGGHSPWRGDPEMVALQTYAGNIGAAVDKPKVSKNGNGTVTVRFGKPNSERVRNVVLIQREDGIWEVIEKY